jgi:hypothetical protein
MVGSFKFLKLLTQCLMAALSFHAGFAAVLLAISLSRYAAPICFLPSYSLVSLSPEKMRTSSRVVDTIALGSAILDLPFGGQLMIMNRATLLECFLQHWFCLVRLGFLSSLFLSLKQVLLKMRFPVPCPSFPLCSLLVTFVNVFLLLWFSWFLVCFCGRVRSPSGGRSSLRLRLGGFVPVCCF